MAMTNEQIFTRSSARPQGRFGAAESRGPIIDQDVTRISHRDSLSDLVQKGKELEKLVLSRAVKLFVEHKVLVSGNKTVIFD